MSDDHSEPQAPAQATRDADDFIRALREITLNQAKKEYGVIGHTEARQAAVALKELVERLLVRVQAMARDEYTAFTRRAVRRMTDDLESGGHLNGENWRGRSIELLYRAFDPMDRILDIHYERDEGMKTSASPERLYEGAGVGVQTSYTTILKALGNLALSQGARLIDLGSGYGRVGLMTGLWREDLNFTGYEYVGHRVEVSCASAARAGIGDRVNFVEQDLADPNFAIPSAEAYYMFDPFNEATYQHVLRQLAAIGRERSVTVVTKADARTWFRDFVAGAGWREPERLDEDTLLVFRSR